MNFRIIAASILLLGTSAFAAENTLVFDLRPPEASVTVAAPAVRPGPRTAKAARKPAARPALKAPAPRTQPPSAGSRTRLASRSLGTGTLVGQIGYITTANAPIFDGPYQQKLYNRCAVGQPVILTGYNNYWYGVRMIDGRTGWVYRGYVQLSSVSLHLPESPNNRAPGANTLQYALSGVDPLLRVAFSYMGIPYKWGGTSSSGIDCSGFVRSVYRKFGVELPRVARDQANVGAEVSLTPGALRPGDRLYFAAHHKYIDHTGIYWGDGLMIHSSGGRGVDITPLWDGGIYERSLVAARRTFATPE